jgi:hypothetical protein
MRKTLQTAQRKARNGVKIKYPLYIFLGHLALHYNRRESNANMQGANTQTMVEPNEHFQHTTANILATANILDFLRKTDTCTVANAIETFNIRMRNEGFIQDTVKCQFPKLATVAGYAVTGRIRTTAPPIANLCYYHRTDWWEYVASLPAPKKH